MDKSDLRKASLQKRDALTKEEIEEKSRMIAEKVFNMEAYQKAENILIYASMRSEVITDEIILDALANGKNVFCPRVTDKDNGIMEFFRITTLEDLQEGYFGIREPEIGDVPDAQDEDTLVIMPVVAFDPEGNRIGYGGGFYDRYLERNPSLFTVALAFECQVTSEAIPFDMHDIRPKVLLTEKA